MNKKQSNKMREMKDSGISLVGKIPQNWEIKRLKYLFKFCKGLPITKDNLIDQGLPVISYGQIHAKTNNGVDVLPHLLRFVDFSYQTFYPLSQVMRGDFVFADTSEDYDGCGNCVYKRNGSLLFAGYHTIIAHSIIESDNRFFAYLFLTDIWRRQIREKVSGIKVFSITQKTLSNSYIILPPLAEQQRIAEFLDRACGKIDGLKADIQAQIDTLEQYKRSEITEAVTHGLNPSAPMKDSGAGWMPLIPLHWKADKLKFHLRQRGIKNQIDKQVLSLYREYGIVPKDSRDDNHNVTSEDVSDYRYVRVGDFVVNKMKAWQGSVAVSNYEGIVSPAYFVYEFSDDLINKRYFHYLMRNKTYATEFRRLSGGIREGQWDLPSEALNNTIILLPPLDEQQEIADYLDNKCAEIEQIIADKKTQIETLDGYKKSLIYEYVTGKKEVL